MQERYLVRFPREREKTEKGAALSNKTLPTINLSTVRIICIVVYIYFCHYLNIIIIIIATITIITYTCCFVHIKVTPSQNHHPSFVSDVFLRRQFHRTSVLIIIICRCPCIGGDKENSSPLFDEDGLWKSNTGIKGSSNAEEMRRRRRRRRSSTLGRYSDGSRSERKLSSTLFALNYLLIEERQKQKNIIVHRKKSPGGVRVIPLRSFLHFGRKGDEPGSKLEPDERLIHVTEKRWP